VEEAKVQRYRVVEICAGAGGQSLGLEVAGFEHELAVEFTDHYSCPCRHDQRIYVADMCVTWR
jgi:DNA (cytosine-5)-methyltransferase 1